MRISLNRQQVDEALTRRGTDLSTFVDAGRRQGKNLEEIAEDLRHITDVPFSDRTLYRWANKLEEVAS